MKIPFFDLQSAYLEDRDAIDAGIAGVLGSGRWIGGPAVEAFETQFAVASGQGHAVACANGTDAITLALWAAGVGPGDEVIVPALSAYPTAVGVLRSGARPVFVDVTANGSMDPAAAEAAVGPKSRAIVPVHLYGDPCDMTRLSALAAKAGLAVVEDCAQAHGSAWAGKPVGAWSAAAAWSFYPTKNLGAAGDAGAVTCASPELAARLRSLRNYGQSDRYRHDEAGINSRLDPLQAAILSARLPKLAARNERRREIAAKYDATIDAIGPLRRLRRDARAQGNGHLYPVFAAGPTQRTQWMDQLAQAGIETLIHYPIAMPDQAATPEDCRQGSFSVARKLAETEFSLPVHPWLTDGAVEAILEQLRSVSSKL